MNFLSKAILFSLTALLIVSCSTEDSGLTNSRLEKSESRDKRWLQSSPFQLSDYRGKKLLVAYWATWCPPCVKEVPHLIKLQNRYKNQQFTVIGISVDRNKASVEKFIAKKGINYPVFMADESVEQTFGTIFGLPTVFLVNGNGDIVQKDAGFLPPEGLEMMVKSFMRE